MSIPRIVDGIERARKVRVRGGEYDYGSIYSKALCPKCKIRTLLLLDSSDPKRGPHYWTCTCGWNSYEGRKP